MKKYWAVITVLLILGCIAGYFCGVVAPRGELLEREYVVGEPKEFEVPPGEVMFGKVTKIRSDSFTFECKNAQTYEKETYKVLVDKETLKKVKNMRHDEKVVVFFDEINEGIRMKQIEGVYGVYEKRDIPHVERFINHEIIYISKYQNCAWTEQLYGRFMDKDGRVYRFDFSETDEVTYSEFDDDEAFYRSLERIRKTEKPVKVVDKSIVKIILGLGSKVDASADYYGDGCAAFDCGMDYELLCHPKTGEFVILETSGDEEARLNDPCARIIVELCKENMY